MALEIEAIIENGVIKPLKHLPLQDGQKVLVTIRAPSDWVEKSYGLLGWTGSAEEAEWFAADAELDYPPPPEEP